MHLLTSSGTKIDLNEVKSELISDAGRLVLRASGLDEIAGRLTHAASAFFGLSQQGRRLTSKLLGKEPPVGVFREKASGLLRLVHKEIVCRVEPGTTAKRRDQILRKFGLEMRSRNAFVRTQYVVRAKGRKKTGAALVDVANSLQELDEIRFATPNFVSEFKRDAIPAIPVAQWHLKNTGAVSGQKSGEDVNAEGAWAITMGKSTIVIAVLDDGVDIDHPNLKSRIKKNPDPGESKDKFGRDFFVPKDSPDHFDPRPKLFQFPFDQMTGNDIHGTPCAGVIAAAGKDGGALGIAPKCKILPVKIFHADNLTSDANVANAIRYAAEHADILSCSWSSGVSDDVKFAIMDDAADGRDGKGCPVFFATGNSFGNPVAFPARAEGAIAVGATTDKAKIADYSNVGPEVWVSAPSSGGKEGIFTTDVSTTNRGFNVGNDAAGGADGLHTNSFGGTSSATPLTAGVAALMLSANKDLTRDQVKQILADTAEKIGPKSGYDSNGHSEDFGFGRVDAEAATKAAKAT